MITGTESKEAIHYEEISECRGSSAADTEEEGTLENWNNGTW